MRKVLAWYPSRTCTITCPAESTLANTYQSAPPSNKLCSPNLSAMPCKLQGCKHGSSHSSSNARRGDRSSLSHSHELPCLDQLADGSQCRDHVTDAGYLAGLNGMEQIRLLNEDN